MGFPVLENELKKVEAKRSTEMPPTEKFALLVYSTRTTNCLYYKEWKSLPDTATKEDRERLLFGLLFSMRRSVARMSPCGKPSQLSCYTTNSYKMHFYQSPTGYMFALFTTVTKGSLRDKLKQYFNQVFLPDVVMNPLYELDTEINLPAFDAHTDQFDF